MKSRGRGAWCVVAAGVVLAPAALRPTAGKPAQAQCLTPRVTLWAAVRDTLWPLIEHREGDGAWAHLADASLPGRSAEWCNPLQNDASAIAAGRDLYRENCATCHGEEGRGDGPGAQVSDPEPYNFTRPEFAGTREPPGPAVLYAIMTRGIDGTTMRGYSSLSGWERLALLAYVTQLPGREAVGSSRAWADSLRARRR